MKIATFYIIKSQSEQANVLGFHQYVLFLTRHFIAQGLKVYLNCNDKIQTETLAEYFWQEELDNLISYNLIGESSKQMSGLEIGYQEVATKRNQQNQLIINLADSETVFRDRFTQIVDFVPSLEKTKLLARKRYKQYRQMGCQMQTIEI